MTQDSNIIIELDTSGLLCPMPLLRLGKTIRGAAEKGFQTLTVRLVATDKKALFDIPDYCKDHGLTLVQLEKGEKSFAFTVRYDRDSYIESIL